MAQYIWYLSANFWNTPRTKTRCRSVVLISTFVFATQLVQSVNLLNLIRNFKHLAIFCGCTTCFLSSLFRDPKDKFSHTAAHLESFPSISLSSSSIATVALSKSGRNTSRMEHQSIRCIQVRSWHILAPALDIWSSCFSLCRLQIKPREPTVIFMAATRKQAKINKEFRASLGAYHGLQTTTCCVIHNMCHYTHMFDKIVSPLSRVVRKSVFRVSDQVRHKTGCTATKKQLET